MTDPRDPVATTRRRRGWSGDGGPTMSVHILDTPMEEVRRGPDGERWCFTCHKRREFERVASAPIVTSLDDTGCWYGPSTRIECTRCRTIDGDLFPGYSREWED